VAGKWQLLNADGGISPTEAGFDTYCLWNTPMTGRERHWNPSIEQDGALLELPEDAYGPTVVADFLVDFIAENKERPFLAYYPMILPHNPFPPTPDSADRNSTDEKQNFIDMVAYVDKCVGRIVDALEENGLRDRTLVIFTSDNGTNSVLTSEFKGEQIQGGKGYTRDYGTRVPFIANWPGTIKPGQVNDDLICFSDVFPTIVEAAGLPPKAIANGDGWSFWPQCLGEAGKKREWIYGYYFPRPYATKFDDMYNHWEVRWARDKQYKLYDNGDLYDVMADVLERQPLPLDAQPEKLMAVRKKLQAALDAYPESGRAIDYDKVTEPWGAPAVIKKR
jgi:arylsulfatase A